MNNNYQVKITSGKISTVVDYTTGVYQGDNMSPVLFIFVMQAFLDSLKLNTEKAEFSFFLENKNGNPQTCKGRLLNKNTSERRRTFDFRDTLYVDNSMFLFKMNSRKQQVTYKNILHALV
jgi:hypothetical protein